MSRAFRAVALAAMGRRNSIEQRAIHVPSPAKRERVRVRACDSISQTMRRIFQTLFNIADVIES